MEGVKIPADREFHSVLAVPNKCKDGQEPGTWFLGLRKRDGRLRVTTLTIAELIFGMDI